jgi:hypothetical protein
MREIYRAAGATASGPFAAWPSFLPDGKAVVFHQTAGTLNPPAPPTQVPDGGTMDGRYNNTLTTWEGSTAELYLARDDGTKAGQRLNSLDGRSTAGVSYLPASTNHPDDTTLNFMPTVNPVPSGGYYWVVFTSRRRYGNLLDTDPWATPGIACPPPDQATASCDYGSPNKKLWVAAIDINNPTGDPSHPAFYLPGQELDAANSRGYWVVDPCKADGTSCETGDECCNGFCRAAGDGGALVCQKPVVGSMCAQEFEKCTTDTDCCNAPTDVCIGGRCAQRGLH